MGHALLGPLNTKVNKYRFDRSNARNLEPMNIDYSSVIKS